MASEIRISGTKQEADVYVDGQRVCKAFGRTIAVKGREPSATRYSDSVEDAIRHLQAIGTLPRMFLGTLQDQCRRSEIDLSIQVS